MSKGIIGTTFDAILGKDNRRSVDTTSTTKKASGNKAVTTADKQEEEFEVTPAAQKKAMQYAADSLKMTKEVISALTGEKLTAGLKQMLQVLVSNPEFRVMIADQNGVLPTKDAYEVGFTFVDKDGKDCKEAAIGVIKTGVNLEDLESKFNMKLDVFRFRKYDQKRLDDAPDSKEIESIKKLIWETYARNKDDANAKK